MGVSDSDDFYSTHRVRVLRLCWLLTLERESAAEVAQEAMTQAWKNWDSISTPGSNPVAWTNRVAVNDGVTYSCPPKQHRDHRNTTTWSEHFDDCIPSGARRSCCVIGMTSTWPNALM
jgi:DNA-directed RNA polymerase specialized sigma24 family protein